MVAAQVPKVSITCGSVTEVRIMYGDLVMMIEVAAFITTMNFFASADTSAGGQRVRRQHVAGEDVDLVAHHQLLRQALGHVGRDAAGVPADELDLAARRRCRRAASRKS